MCLRSRQPRFEPSIFAAMHSQLENAATPHPPGPGKRLQPKLRAGLIVLLLLFGFAGQAQEKSRSVQYLNWTRYAGTVVFGGGWSVMTELETRRYWNGLHQHQYIAPRATLFYGGMKGLKYGIGGTYFLQALPHDPEAEIGDLRPEWRPHANLTQTQKNGRLEIKNRFQYEARFFGDQTPSGERDWRFNHRFRYLLQVAHPLTGANARVGVKLKAFDEVMFNAGSSIGLNVFDQNRVGGGLDWRFSTSWTLATDYIWWWQQRSSGTDFWSRHIARFTIKHKVDLRSE